MMKKSLLKDSMREIRRSLNRFLSILAIVAIGVGFFAGLKSTGPDMKLTANRYFDEQHLANLRLLSTHGFIGEDVDAVRALPEVAGVMPGYSKDVLYDDGQSSLVVKIISTVQTADQNTDNDLNRPVLLSGRMPEKAGECVVDSSLNTPDNFLIGNEITFSAGEQEEDLLDTLSTDTFTVVGVVRSPAYISFERGTSSIGKGTVKCYVMVTPDSFSLEVYTDLFLSYTPLRGVDTYTEEYDDLSATLVDQIEAFSPERESIRFAQVKEEFQTKIDDARKELAEGEQTQREELQDARKKLDDGWREYTDGNEELNENILTFNREIADAQEKLDDARKTIDDGWDEYFEGKKEYQKAKNEAEKKFAEARKQLEQLKGAVAQMQPILEQSKVGLEQYRSQLDAAKDQLDAQQMALNQYKPQLTALSTAVADPLSASVSDLDAVIALLPSAAKTLGSQVRAFVVQCQNAGSVDSGAQNTLQGQITMLQNQIPAQQQQIDAGYNQLQLQEDDYAQKYAAYLQSAKQLSEYQALIVSIPKQIAAGELELEEAHQKLIDARKELDDGEKEYTESLETFQKEKADGLKKINDARIELADAYQELQDGEREYIDGKAESDQKLADARVEIADAQQELDEVEPTAWHVLDRSYFPSHKDYGQNADKIDAIAQVFPIFFILVAALVCLTSMTRMIEEQRTQIGTLKAMGYNNHEIISKFLLYAGISSFAGSLFGLAIGFQVFPKIIVAAYNIMYAMPAAITPFRLDYTVIFTVVAVFSICLTTLFACWSTLSQTPAALMRPKAPKPGKRVFLERLPFVWNRMNFTKKVTVRNLFRYKKKIIMTVAGIAGCTALMLTGFGIKDSISDIATKQYGDIFTYDVSTALEEKITQSQLDNLRESLSTNDMVTGSLFYREKTYDAVNGKIVSVRLLAPTETEQLGEFISLHTRQGKQPVSLTDTGVVLTEKLSNMLGVSIGDSFELVSADNERYTLTVDGITENYAFHYVYISPALYEKTFGEAVIPNMVVSSLVKGEDGEPSGEVQTDFSSQMLSQKGVLAVVFTDQAEGTFSNTITSLNYVVLVLIISAGALAFVVLYNLSNINVNERIREIATIKVLGFYDKEVSAYIFRENILLTLAGIVLGLIAGIFLHQYVIITAEVDVVMFGREIQWLSFLLAGLMTLIFAFLVNLVLHYKLKKVDMIESLKSVE